MKKYITTIIAILFGNLCAYEAAPEKIIERRLDESEKVGIAWFRFQATFNGHTYTGGTDIFGPVMMGKIGPETILILREKSFTREIIGYRN